MSSSKRKPVPQAQKKTQAATLTYKGKNYVLDKLSAEARQQANNIQLVERHLQQLGIEIAIAEMAHAVKSQELSGFLPEKKAPGNRKKDTVVVNEIKYAIEDFGEEGTKNLAFLQTIQQRMQQLKADQQMAQVARQAYIPAFEKALGLA